GCSRGRWDSIIANLRRVHDEALRRIPDEVERIASHQRYGWSRTRLEYRDIVRKNNFYVVDCIRNDSVKSRKLRLATNFHILQRAEESVAMSCNSKIAGATRHCGPLDSACTTIENEFVGTVEHRHLELQFGKPQHSQRRIEVHRQRLLISSDTLLRPETVI